MNENEVRIEQLVALIREAGYRFECSDTPEDAPQDEVAPTRRRFWNIGSLFGGEMTVPH